MQNKEACKKVTSLLALYIDNKLEEETKNFVTAHLENCEECYQKYLVLQQLISDLRKAYDELLANTKKQELKRQFNIKEYENFHSNLSAYFDNELPLNDSLNIKKYMIKFPNARKDLEEMYILHKIINNTTTCIKKTMGNDYVQKISYKIQGKPENFKTQVYLKIASYTLVILTFALLIFSTIPIGKTVIEKGIKYFKQTIYVEVPSQIELATD